MSDPVQQQTPVTMENAMLFGFKAGLGFIIAQALVGGFVAFVWYFVTHMSLTR